jgi:hypothetical protein
MGYLKIKVLKLDLYDISFIEINSTSGVEVSAVLYSVDHDEIYQFSQNMYFKKIRDDRRYPHTTLMSNVTLSLCC